MEELSRIRLSTTHNALQSKSNDDIQQLSTNNAKLSVELSAVQYELASMKGGSILLKSEQGVKEKLNKELEESKESYCRDVTGVEVLLTRNKILNGNQLTPKGMENYSVSQLCEKQVSEIKDLKDIIANHMGTLKKLLISTS